MDRHYHLRPYSKSCKSNGCKELATQQVVNKAGASVGEYCYGHAQIAIAELEKAHAAYQEVLDRMLKMGGA